MASVRELITEVTFKVLGQKDYDKFGKRTDEVKDDLKKVTKNSDKAARAIGKMAKAAGRAGSLIGKAFKKIRLPAILGGAGIVGAGLGLLKLASEAEEMESAFAFSFGSATKSVDEWAKSTGRTINRSSNILKQGALGLNLLFKTAVDEEDAVELAKQFTVLSQDLASFLNLDPEDALAKLKGGLIGNAESLRSMNIFLTETEVGAKAVELGLAKTAKSASQAAKIQARAALITEKATFANGDAERTAGGFANTLKGLVGRLKDLGAELGKKLLPAATNVLNRLIKLIGNNTDRLVAFFASMGKGLTDFVEGGGLQRLIVGFVKFGSVAGRVAAVTIRVFGKLTNFIRDNSETLKLVMAALGIVMAVVFAPFLIAATKVALIVTVLVSAAKLLMAAWDPVKSFFASIFDTIESRFRVFQTLALRAAELVKKLFKNSPLGLLLRGGKFIAEQVGGRISNASSGPSPLAAGATTIGARSQTNSFNADIVVQASGQNGEEIGRDIANGMQNTYRRNSHLDDLGSPDDA